MAEEGRAKKVATWLGIATAVVGLGAASVTAGRWITDQLDGGPSDQVVRACDTATSALTAVVSAGVSDPARAQDDVSEHMGRLTDAARRSGDSTLQDAALDLRNRVATPGGDAFRTYALANAIRKRCSALGSPLGRLGPEPSIESSVADDRLCVSAAVGSFSAHRLDFVGGVDPPPKQSVVSMELGNLMAEKGWPGIVERLGKLPAGVLTGFVGVYPGLVGSFSNESGQDLRRAAADFLAALEEDDPARVVSSSAVVSDRCQDRGFIFPDVTPVVLDDVVCAVSLRDPDIVRGLRLVLAQPCPS